MAAFGFGRECHKALKNKCQEIKKGLESRLQGGGRSMALALSFGLDVSVPVMLPPPLRLLASLPPPTSGCCSRDRHDLSFSPRRLARRGPLTPGHSVWKKGPRLPPRLPQEMRSLEVRGQQAAPPEGAKQPSAAACIVPAPAAEQGREAEPCKGEGEARLFLFM